MMKGLIIQQHPAVEENMSNLTSASGEASVSSGNRAETGTLYPQQSFASPNQTQVVKKKRNLPGNPDPDAEVIALSPRTLMATNRFVCEICNKGFQRDQNLQLHRRGHNLPWKLKQRTSKEVRKKVYVCPEPSCVHHDPSRALGDLTGIKKHFCRKHGEKKWKCDKCSKRYAVQSDWKAHSKTCGTREYRCDCGTLFSRRDSFITHRAFCDALAEESARAANTLLSTQPGPSTSHINLQPQFNSHDLQAFSLKREQQQQQLHFNQRSEVPPWLACSSVVLGAGPGPPPIDLSSSIFSTRLDQEFSRTQPSTHQENFNSSPTPSLPPYHPLASPHMSATALLQKAAQMGATMSKPSSSATLRPHQAHMLAANTGNATKSVPTTTTGFGLGLSSREEMESGFVHVMDAFANKAGFASSLIDSVCATAGSGGPSLLQDMMNSFSSTTGFDGSSFQDAFGMLSSKRNGNLNEALMKTTSSTTHIGRNEGGGSHGGGVAGGNDGLTRDFLGLRAFSHRDILNIAGFDHCMTSSPYDQTIQNQKPWQG
ncbi:PREDICTED: protein indeterminate-domain 7-like isoform X1 [Nelumbo nucifera]|uniref:Protein indeterminate-domain 7-like isoform X1 n=1 Tax=Nelumbo nucifera TaxID=4432 RepID=A0A1U7Z4G9_NELNU|nr:PREDICTED: protein indeterminate-domain 7-like isoform X1 [Nelumbo nucifera]